MAFNKRSMKHEEIQNYLTIIFRDLNITYEKYGVESGRGLITHKELMTCPSCNTAKWIRHQPDTFMVVKQNAYFIDIKTQLRYNTPNFSVELDSYDTLLSLTKYGCKVLMIFNKMEQRPFDLTACFIEQIKIDRFDDRHYLSEVKEKGLGSGTPFGLINKKDDYFEPFDILLDRIRK